MATTKKPPRLPKKEMLTWLKGRTEWNHAEWEGLLDELREAGFGYWTDSEEGRAALGEYLESKR